MTKAVFIDKDGTIVEDAGFVHRIEEFKLIPNAVEGLRLLKDYKLFIVSNQSGIGRGHSLGGLTGVVLGIHGTKMIDSGLTGLVFSRFLFWR